MASGMRGGGGLLGMMVNNVSWNPAVLDWGRPAGRPAVAAVAAGICSHRLFTGGRELGCGSSGGLAERAFHAAVPDDVTGRAGGPEGREAGVSR